MTAPGDDGPVLVLVNNAGVLRNRATLSPQLEDEQWQTVIDVNLTATSAPPRAGAAEDDARRRVINVASVAGIRADPGPSTRPARPGS